RHAHAPAPRHVHAPRGRLQWLLQDGALRALPKDAPQPIARPTVDRPRAQSPARFVDAGDGSIGHDVRYDGRDRGGWDGVVVPRAAAGAPGLELTSASRASPERISVDLLHQELAPNRQKACWPALPRDLS